MLHGLYSRWMAHVLSARTSPQWRQTPWFLEWGNVAHSGDAWLVRFKCRNEAKTSNCGRWALAVDIAGNACRDASDNPTNFHLVIFSMCAKEDTRETSCYDQVYPGWLPQPVGWATFPFEEVHDWTYLGKLDNIGGKKAPVLWYADLLLDAHAYFRELVEDMPNVDAETLEVELENGEVTEREYPAVDKEEMKTQGRWNAKHNCQQFCQGLAKRWSLTWPHDMQPTMPYLRVSTPSRSQSQITARK